MWVHFLRPQKEKGVFERKKGYSIVHVYIKDYSKNLLELHMCGVIHVFVTYNFKLTRPSMQSQSPYVM